MPRIDEELTRRFRSFDPAPRPREVVSQIAARRRKVAIRRRVSAALLAMSVLVGTIGGYAALTRAFDGRGDPARATTTGINGPIVTVMPDTHRTTQLFLYPDLDAQGRAITPASQAFVSDPAASPDGRSIAYVRSPPILGEPTEGELVILDLTTEMTTVIANGLFSDLAWSPDGRSLAATLDGEGIGIVLIDVASGDMRHVVAGIEPSWSPDGTMIAYEVPQNWRLLAGNRPGVFVVSAQGGKPQLIAEDGASPAWSPDGARIAYVLGGIGIWTANPAGGEPELVVGTEPGGTAQDSMSTVAHVGWSPDGSYLTYTAETDTGSRILADPLDGPVPTELPPGSNYTWLPQADPPLDFPGTDRTVDGVDYPVCRVMQIAGDFGSEALDTAWVFQKEHTPGQGCEAGEGFQHLAVGSATHVEVISDRLTACSDGSDCWPAAAVDLDGDGVDEIAVGAGWRPGYMDLVFYRLVHHDDGSVTLERIGAACGATESCASPWYFSIDVNSGTEAGVYCGSEVGPPTDSGLVTWQLDEDGDGWMFQQYELTPDGFATDPRAGAVTHGHPADNEGLDVGYDGESLCGRPLMQLDDVDPERAREIKMQQGGMPEPPSIVGTDAVTAGLCNASSKSGDIDGDGASDSVAFGTTSGGSSSCLDGDRRIRIDLGTDGSVEVDRSVPGCSAWCFPLAILDLNGDGIEEIILSEDHLAQPVSAVAAVYRFDPGSTELVPIPFPDGSNRFDIVSAGSAIFADASCGFVEGEGGTFTI